MGFIELMVWQIKGGWAKKDKLSAILGLGVFSISLLVTILRMAKTLTILRHEWLIV